MAGVPVVLTNHFMPDNLFAHAHIPPRLHGVVASLAWQDMIRVARTADYLTTPTQRAAELLASKGVNRTGEAAACGIDLDRCRPRPQDRAHARAHVGRRDRE